MDGILDVVVVGAGSAGLAASYCLRKSGLTHRVIERGRIGETWRTQRWTSFRLNTPAVRSMLVDDSYTGPDPWGALSQHEFITYLEDYAGRHRLPVQTGVAAQDLADEDGIFCLQTSQGTYRSKCVVIASGNLNRPIRPSWSSGLPGELMQIDCSAYRSTETLGDGAVLVVGSGQSGGQIAEDLVLAGTEVYLATSRTGRLVRRYRGGDTFNWLTISGFLDVPRRELVRPDGSLPARGLLGATHTISLQSLSAQGVALLGRFTGCDGDFLLFGGELEDHVRFADESSAAVKRFLDQYIRHAGLDAPEDEGDPAETVAQRLPDPPIRLLDWRKQNIGTLIWCTGFAGDFSWIRVPGAVDAGGRPVHQEGVCAVSGLYFAGLDFAATRKSGTIPGVVTEVPGLVDHLARYAMSR